MSAATDARMKLLGFVERYIPAPDLGEFASLVTKLESECWLSGQHDEREIWLGAERAGIVRPRTTEEHLQNQCVRPRRVAQSGPADAEHHD